MIIDIANDFSKAPAGRYESDGPFSGEGFRNQLLRPALERLKPSESLEVRFDGTEGYGSSFLEEAFGGLVRTDHVDKQRLRQCLHLVSSDQALIDEIWEYIDQAEMEFHAPVSR